MNDNLERKIQFNVTITCGIPTREEIKHIKNDDETIEEYEQGYTDTIVNDLYTLVERHQNDSDTDLFGLSDICDIQLSQGVAYALEEDAE